MSHLPGLRVIYPAFADDASGLLRTAIRSRGMTFCLEPKYLYNRKEARTAPTDPEFCIPFGQGRVRREGEDLSIITYGTTVHFSLEVAEKLAGEGHSIEVFDLRSIKPLDRDGIVASVRRTGKVLIVHEDHMFNGIGAKSRPSWPRIVHGPRRPHRPGRGQRHPHRLFAHPRKETLPGVAESKPRPATCSPSNPQVNSGVGRGCRPPNMIGAWDATSS